MTKLPENVPTATIPLDKPRTLAFTLGAMRRVKEATGKSVQKAFSELDTEEDGALLIGPVVWAMLINRDREGVSIEDVEEMLHPGNLAAITEAIGSLASQEQPKGAEGNAPAPAKTKKTKKSKK